MAEKLMKYADAVKQFDPVIGLETHVELSTNTKLFCPAHVEFGGDPNTQLTPVSLGLPGSLPVLNEAGIDLMLCGHYHRYHWIDDGSRGVDFPILVNSNNDCLRVSADAKGIDLKVVNTAGAVIKQHRIDKKNK